MDLPGEEENKQDEEERVNEAEQNERGDDLVRGYYPRQRFGASQHFIHNPWLAPHLRGEPPRLVGDLRAEDGKYQGHQKPARQRPRQVEQPAAPPEKTGD